MIRTLESFGVAALALLVVLATSHQHIGLVRCHVTQELMPVACCDAVAAAVTDIAAASAPSCCCEAIDPAPPVPLATAVKRATTKATTIAPLPHHQAIARLDPNLRALPPHQQALVVRHRSTHASSSRPAYDRYCSYLL